MTQPRKPVVEFVGPWAGLNTTQPARKLDPRFATVAKNVLLYDGTIRPRPPIVDFVSSPAYWQGNQFEAVLSMLALDLDPGGASDYGTQHSDVAIIVKAQAAGVYGLWVVRPKANVVNLISNLSMRPATVVLAGGWLYVLDGTNGDGIELPRMVKTDGTINHTYLMGIDGPTGYHVGLADPGAGPPADGRDVAIGAPLAAAYSVDPITDGTYDYAVTLVNGTCGTESNPYITSGPITYSELVLPAGHVVKIVFKLTGVAPRQGATHWRVYRKNVTEGQVGYRLVHELPVGTTYVLDNLAEEDITLSSETAGPWAPCRNGLPPPASVGCVWKNRLWTNNLADGRQLHFSAPGQFDYFDADDWFGLETEQNDQITGMAVLAGQLVVLKEHSIWVVAGDTVTATNETIATGVELADEQAPEVYRTRSAVGCANTCGGNGCIVAGNPALLYFNGPTGFYAFDGAESFKVSTAIKATWDAFIDYGGGMNREMGQAISYALDTKHDILYMAQFLRGTGGVDVLAYHFNLETKPWTFLSILPGVECIASGIGYPDVESGWPPPIWYTPLLVAGDIHVIGMMSTVHLQEQLPAFEYQTGRLIAFEGLQRSHVYYVQFLHHDGPDVDVTFGFKCDRDDAFTTQYRTIVNKLFTTMRVGRTTQGISLSIAGGGGVAKWRPEMSFVGFQIDLEASG